MASILSDRLRLKAQPVSPVFVFETFSTAPVNQLWSPAASELAYQLWSRLSSIGSPTALAVFYYLGNGPSLSQGAFSTILGKHVEHSTSSSLFKLYLTACNALGGPEQILAPSYCNELGIRALGAEPIVTNPSVSQEIKTEIFDVPENFARDEKSADPEEVDAGRWLLDVCNRLERFNNDGSVVMSSQDIFIEIINILSSDKSDEMIQQQLFDLIGVDGFDQIVTIIAKRRALCKATDQVISTVPNVPHSLLSITSQDSKSKFRKSRQQQRKMDRMSRPDPSAIQVSEQNHDENNLLDQFRSADFGTGAQKLTLPSNSTREYFEGWEQVVIPATQRPLPADYAASLCSITEIDVWARPAFSGLTQFNRMQSRCLKLAYSSNENLLICAPTGAGKTNVALLCILHEIKLHVSVDDSSGHVPVNSLSAETFKVVYIAPMKALAQEIVGKLSKALRFLGVVVRELTGDMQLSKKEIEQTHIIVTTPEKWDVITRKSNDLISLVRLLIFDEVHILHDTRGSVIEVLVARTIRQVESSQLMIRIVGLSATLPNYEDVASFLKVNPSRGLFAFDQSYRPVPLTQTYIGVSHANSVRRLALLNEVCHKKLMEALENDYQVMIFVHSRKDTAQTAQAMIEFSRQDDTLHVLERATGHPKYGLAKAKFAKSNNRDLRFLSTYGIGIHNAGMLRDDRNTVETQFENGVLRILVTTATLAWGVNLPAHTVIIKGTQVYSSQHGGYIDLSMLDVMQIFGRAGRPQYDDSGEGIIITQGDSLPRYLRLLMHAMPIESRLIETLADNLNAEINLGTVANITEAQRWISYTYLYVRMMKNPMHYGLTFDELMLDPTLAGRRRSLIDSAVARLLECRMLHMPPQSEVFMPTDLGRTASFFYISHDSISLYLKMLSPSSCDDDIILRVLAASMEFAQIKVRNEEISELEGLRNQSCPIILQHVHTTQDKVNILLQAYISRHRPSLSSLVSDTNYITQSAGRICRALYEITLKRGWSHVCLKFLSFCKMIDRRMWDWETPLRQFSGHGSPVVINEDLAYQIEQRNLTFSQILSYSDNLDTLASLLPSVRQANVVMRAARSIPRLSMFWQIQPVNSGVCKITMRFEPDFQWSDRIHGSVQCFRFLAFESQSFDKVHHAEEVLMHRRDYDEGAIDLEFYLSVASQENLPSDLVVAVDSDLWLGAETAYQVSFDGVLLPPKNTQNTPLLDLQLLPVSALQNKRFESLYKFAQFNAVQTQCFHMLYHSDSNILLGAPTGSGKTIAAELTILKLLKDSPKKRTVYIAPLKALARERLIDWRLSLSTGLGLEIVEITGDTNINGGSLRSAGILITTPEKFDSMSRRWRDRRVIQNIGLVIIDELHLLGADRGPILEMIVSRLRFMSAATGDPVRIVGLSTSLANADDVVDWLNIDPRALYNFHPSVRPTPLSVHISGFPGSRHYCPRMEMLNKPTYASIMAYAHNKPALVFVSSRRQTRLTALGLISFSVADGAPQKFLHMEIEDLNQVLPSVSDSCLRHVLEFGIGLHHAGLCDHDRRVVESLFSSGKIQVLVCTSTLAWGVNLPAHLCVIKGTEFFDASKRRYIDYPITDVVQMMGRAGRPQFRCDEAHACVLVHEPKKQFYKKFLFQPFPVESSLLHHLHDHLNAEIQSSQLGHLRDCIDFLSWTFLFKRICKNPTFYGLTDSTSAGIRLFLLDHLRKVISDLSDAGCVIVEGDVLRGTELGRLAADFYLHYQTVALFDTDLSSDMSIEQVLVLLCNASEFADIPVRHNEDNMNESLSHHCRWKSPLPSSSPHMKSFLLFQFLMQRHSHSVPDYITDTKTVVDQSGRVLQAMLTLSASRRFALTTLSILSLLQCLSNHCTEEENPLKCLPLESATISWMVRQNLSLSELVVAHRKAVLSELLKGAPHVRAQKQVLTSFLSKLPLLEMSWIISSKGDAVEVSLKFISEDSRDDSWWIAISQGPQLCEFIRVKQRQSLYNMSLPATNPDHPLHLHAISERWRGLDQIYKLG